MPTTTSPKLTVTREGAKFKLTVTYHAEFNPIERFLSGLGMKFIERIVVIGVDPPEAITDTVLARFSGQFIEVPSVGVGTKEMVVVPTVNSAVFASPSKSR